MRYTMSHQTPVGTNLAIWILTGAATIRAKIYDLILGSDATPADVATEFSLQRHTAVGSGGTALTEEPLDPLTVAPTAAGLGGTFTGQPTWGNELMQIALNQRATFRWVAAPDGELISVANANNGIGLESQASGGTPNCNSTVMWKE
jgi:hypothetical protein